jgi:gamma-glutamylcysteine synthetase
MPNHKLPGADDTKSSVSKISRVSSKTKITGNPIAPTSGPIILSREEELRLAREKKDRMDSIKRQYS